MNKSDALRDREEMLRFMEADAQADHIENLGLIARRNNHTGEDDLSDPATIMEVYYD